MAGRIGFVFDEVTPSAYSSHPVPPALPVYTNHFQPSYIPPYQNDYPPMHYNNPPNQIVQMTPGNYGGAYEMKPHMPDSRFEQETSRADEGAYGHHASGGGIPGGKLGVLGGAAVAGAGTALAVKFLPKKLKKNKLVKYGLPLAGAGAAGYKLNQMNGKHY